jgi:hypothetical protein
VKTASKYASGHGRTPFTREGSSQQNQGDAPIDQVSSNLGTSFSGVGAVSSAVEHGVHIAGVAGSRPAPPTKRDPSIVYFIKCGPYLKVGATCDVAARLIDMKVGCPFDFELIGTIVGGIPREREIHRALDQWRHRGEWFHHNDSVNAFIRGLLDGPCPKCGNEHRLLKVGERREGKEVISKINVWHCTKCDTMRIAGDSI